MNKPWICDDCGLRFADNEVDHRDSDGYPICPKCKWPLDCDDPEEEEGSPDEDEESASDEE